MCSCVHCVRRSRVKRVDLCHILANNKGLCASEIRWQPLNFFREDFVGDRQFLFNLDYGQVFFTCLEGQKGHISQLWYYSLSVVWIFSFKLQTVVFHCWSITFRLPVTPQVGSFHSRHSETGATPLGQKHHRGQVTTCGCNCGEPSWLFAESRSSSHFPCDLMYFSFEITLPFGKPKIELPKNPKTLAPSRCCRGQSLRTAGGTQSKCSMNAMWT